MDKINDKAFRAMCDLWGVDDAVNAARRMGMEPTQEQIARSRQKEDEMQERWNNIFKQKPKEG